MKRNLKILFIALMTICMLMSLIACSSAGGGADMSDGSADNGYTGGDGYDVSTESTSDMYASDRKIIKTVTESVQTDKYDDFIASLSEAVSNAGGYISSKEERGESYYNSESLRYTYMVIRIPAENLDTFTAKVDSLAVVTSYNENIQDVTTAYIDVESRIAVLAAEESALLDMLTKATTVDTALEIRKRLLDVQSDLASLRAQKESYDDKIAYSTVNLRISEVRRAAETNPGFFEEVGGNFSDSLYNIGQGFRSFGVWLLGDFLYILLALVGIAAAAFIAKCVYTKIRKQKVAKDSKNNKEEK